MVRLGEFRLGDAVLTRPMSPNMLHHSEAEYLKSLPRNQVVTDIGCWLGGSTICFEGCEVWSYDRFEWEPYMDLKSGDRRQAGSCFMEDWKRHVGAYHRVQKVDCETGILDLPQSIDIAFFDVLKTPGILKNLFPQVLPRCKPGGLVIDQDFGWAPTVKPWRIWSWCQLYPWLLRNSLVQIWGGWGCAGGTV